MRKNQVPVILDITQGLADNRLASCLPEKVLVLSEMLIQNFCPVVAEEKNLQKVQGPAHQYAENGAHQVIQDSENQRKNAITP